MFLLTSEVTGCAWLSLYEDFDYRGVNYPMARGEDHLTLAEAKEKTYTLAVLTPATTECQFALQASTSKKPVHFLIPGQSNFFQIGAR